MTRLSQVVAECLCLLMVFSASGSNLVVNPDFSEDDGFGGILGWSHETWADGTVNARSLGGGVACVEFGGSVRVHWQQLPVSLKHGRKYRLNAEVRTSGLNGATIRFLLRHWDRNKKYDVGTPPFPNDTHGKWRKIEWTGTVEKSKNPDAYIISLSGTCGSNGFAKVEFRNLSLRPLRKCEGDDAMGLAKCFARPFVPRIVPIDPLLSQVDAESGRMMFYWPGKPRCGVESCRLLASVDGGIAQESTLDKDGRARVAFGRLNAGRHRIEVKVVSHEGKLLAENSYDITAREKMPDGPKGKRLNNFVVQLVDMPLADGTVKFFIGKRGWVWLSFDGCDSALGYVDAETVPAVRPRKGERYVEAMRYLDAGWHELKVQGARKGHLRIHAVKSVSTSTWPLWSGPCRFSEGKHELSHEFSRRFLLGVNTVRGAENYIHNPECKEIGYYRERGFAIYDRVSISTSSLMWLQSELLYRKLTGTGWSKGYDISVDEGLIDGSRASHVVLSENIWKMLSIRPGQRVNMNWGDASSQWYDDPKVHTSLLSAIANTGDGCGVSLPEVYAPVLDNPEGLEKWLDVFARQISAIGEMVPGAHAMTQFNASPWVDIGGWCDYPCPSADIKAHYSKMFCAFATRPEFAANSGIDAGAMFAADEELRRWIARLFRYYALEGGTENLAEVYGYKWNSSFVANCDFADGLSGWRAISADTDSLRAGCRSGYGAFVQCRKKVPQGTGDNFAEFVTTAKGTNCLEQRIKGLVPGKPYALLFCVADADQIDRPTVNAAELAFSARLEGAEELPGLRFAHTVKSRYKAKGAGKNEKVHLTLYRYVFLAKSADATLRFRDCSDSEKTRSPGSRQILNYIVFRPYYVETPEEIDEITAIIAGAKKSTKE